MKPPILRLAFGQIGWVLNMGQLPPPRFLHQLSYLKQIGIPDVQDKRLGRGNALSYSWYDLLECGVCLYAIHNGIKTDDLKTIFAKHRSRLHNIFRQAIEPFPEDALLKAWVKSRGKDGEFMPNAIDLRLHSRYSTKPLSTEFTFSMDSRGMPEWVTQQNFGIEQHERLIPLTTLALQWTAWALEAPTIKVGRKASQ